MKLSQKFTLAFLVVIVLFGGVSIVATSRLLDSRMRQEVSTSEVLFARSLATRIFRYVRDREPIPMTDLLFDEQQLRSEKIEYLLVTGGDGQVLAHTFLAPIPQELRNLDHYFGAGIKQRIQTIDSPSLYVVDVAVPVLEGIAPIGAIHIGLKGAYLESIKQDVTRVTVIATLAIALVAGLLAFFMTHLIVRPLRLLTQVANELSNGNIDVSVPDIRTKDEIRDLSEAIRGVIAALTTLLGEFAEPAAPVVISSGASIVTGVVSAPGSEVL
jgi:HAMP domain-containing protein